MGVSEIESSGFMETQVGYHPLFIGILTKHRESGVRTLSGGQFDWDGHLAKSDGGAQRFAQNGRKPLPKV